MTRRSAIFFPSLPIRTNRCRRGTSLPASCNNIDADLGAPLSNGKAAPVGSIATIALRGVVFFAIAAFIVGIAFSRMPHASGPRSLPQALLGAPSAAESLQQSRERVAFFEQRLARDPNDIAILNSLAASYLQRLRESGSFSDLDLAMRASRHSLDIVPAARNVAGLTARAMAEFAAHEFGAARDDAQTLIGLDGSGTPYALVGDANAELGNYPAAAVAYAKLRRAVGESDENVATRRARMALLQGDNEAAKGAFSQALAIELARLAPSRERVAWYSWQLGDTAFFTGDYATAKARYDDALAAYPGYFRALASNGRLAAARGDYPGAIADYRAAIEQLPDPTFVAELGDVYALSHDRAAAQREYALVDFIGHLSRVNGVMYNRQLVMFDADHGRDSLNAFVLARREYRVRHDILGADAVAWAALKAGKIHEATTAMRAALRLGTRDPRLLFHAGMVARARGDLAAARSYLLRALALSPQFDPLQSTVARTTLQTLFPRGDAGG